MAFRFERFAAGGVLGMGLLMALAGTGCDQFLSRWAMPAASPTPGQAIAHATPTPGPRTLRLAPETLRLNVPSDEPCPCPFESTASFDLGSLSTQSMRWSMADEAVASVSTEGVVAARATGSTIVTVEAEGWTLATASIEVVDQGGRAAVTLQ